MRNSITISELKTNDRLRPLRSPKDIVAVHQASLDLLGNGIQVESEVAREIFHGHGCQVDKSSGRVKIPAHVAESAIQSVPSQFLLAGRTRANDVRIQPGHTYFTATSGSVNYIDPKSRCRRQPTQKDLIECVKLMDAVPDMDLVNRVLVPGDVNVECVALHQLSAVLCHSSKPAICSSGNRTIIHTAIEMAVAVAGGCKALKERPLMLVMASPISPLMLADECCDTIIAGVKAGLPVAIAVSAIGGASAPVTMAGLLVVHNTDILAGVILAQLTTSGSPVLYSNYSGLLDMKAGLMSYGSPSLASMNMAVSQMAEFYGIPWYGTGLVGDSHALDYQAALESSLTGMTAAMTGANIVTGAGCTEGIMTFSPAKLLCDCQYIKMLKEITAPMVMTDEHLACQVIAETGPGRDFLSTEHTLTHFREQTSYELIDHSPFEAWQENGSPDMIERASAMARQIMASHRPDPLDPKIEPELKRIITTAEKASCHDL